MARALLARYERGLHIDVDGIREMVVSGLASPLEPSEETERQFGLAVTGSAQLAALYQAAGFAVAIEGAIDPWHAAAALTDAGVGDAMVGVELHPPVNVALRRNRTRQGKSFDTSILEEAIAGLDLTLRRNPAPASFTRIDNGAESINDTVERILALVPRA